MPKTAKPRRSTSTYVTSNTGVNKPAATKKKKSDSDWLNRMTKKKKSDFDKKRRVLVGDKPRTQKNTFGATKTSAPSKTDAKRASNYKKVKTAIKKRATRNATRKAKR